MQNDMQMVTQRKRENGNRKYNSNMAVICLKNESSISTMDQDILTKLGRQVDFDLL